MSEGKADILIVDDTPANLRLLSRMLAAEGHQVRPVPDGALALAAVQAKPPDLILLDIRMPGMDGYQVCEQLKASASTRDIPVIFLSALGDTEHKVRAFSAGGVDYVTKPFQVREVVARVETHLALWGLQRQLQATNQRMARELALAGQVQASFIPRSLPQIPGWQLAASLQPARETSGDFYDLLPLPGRRLGILIADVADKGAAAALLMALSCTLIRTYAAEYHDRPEAVLATANRRFRADMRSVTFVTLFYGILDLDAATLTYCNAGHNPPYILRAGASAVAESGAVRALEPTGTALGILDDAGWDSGMAQLGPGDALLLYTDGVTEADRGGGVRFGEERLLAAAQRGLEQAGSQGISAAGLQERVLAEVQRFVGDEPQSDDIALVVVVRD